MADTKIIIAVMIVIIAFSIGIFTIVWAIADYRKQRKFLEGIKYRKKYGLFDINQYAGKSNAIKELSWKKQKNTGPDPETFQKRLPFIDYFDESVGLICDKEAAV